MAATKDKIIDVVTLKGVPGWAKGLILLIVVLFLVWIIYRYIKTSEERKKGQDIKKDKDMLYDQGQRPSYTRTQYKNFADKLFWAGSGKNISGTQEDQIYSVFDNMKNDLDIVLLTEAFGDRKWWPWQDTFNLGGYITDEMEEPEIKVINDKLAKKGIKARF